jgi:hypothetical protein
MKMIRLKIHPNITRIVGQLSSSSNKPLANKNRVNNSFTQGCDERVFSKESQKGCIINKSIVSKAFSQSSKRQNKPNDGILTHLSPMYNISTKKINKIPRPKANITDRLKSLSKAVSEKLLEIKTEEGVIIKKAEFVNKFLIFYEKAQGEHKLTNKEMIKSHIKLIKKQLDEMLILNKRDEMNYNKQLERVCGLEHEIEILICENQGDSRQISFFNKVNDTKTILKLITKTVETLSKQYRLYITEIKTELRARRNSFREKHIGEKFSHLFEDYELDILNRLDYKFTKAMEENTRDCDIIYEKFKLYQDIIKSSNIFISNDTVNNTYKNISELCNYVFI